MGHSQLLATRDLSVFEAHCPVRTVTGPREIQGVDRYEVLLVRRGCFRFRDARGEELVDPVTCVLGSPRQSAEIAHPAPGGDTYVHMILSVEAWNELAHDEQAPLSARVSGQMQVAVRLMMASAHYRLGANMAVEEQALTIVADAVAQADPERVTSGWPYTARKRRQLAEDARIILAEDPAVASMRDVATRLACSTYHLSRLFHSCVGVTMARYRTRLRVNLAVQLLADGGSTIAEVADQCGFADQAHLTRAVHTYAGITPRALSKAVAEV